ncbi:hypothetical protein N8258_01530 [Algibacter sp.]|nr:hypothetical protein [Algibacter sp.]
MSLLSKLLGTDKKEKKLIKELRLQLTTDVSLLITEGYIDRSNYFDWRVIWEDKLSYHDNKMVDIWCFKHEISQSAAISGFLFITGRRPISSSELLRTLLIAESNILDKEIYPSSLESLERKIVKTYFETYEGKFKV